MNNYEGVVTYRNDQLLYFKLDDSIILNAAIYLLHVSKVDIKLPKPGSKVQIETVHPLEDQIENNHVGTLCFRTKLHQTSFSSASKGLYLLWMMEDYKIGGSDLFQITNAYESLKNKVSTETDLGEAVILFVERELIKLKCKIPKIGSCQRSLLRKFEFKTISMLKQVDITKTYAKFPYWSFGTCWNKEEEILVGYLFPHDKYGMLCIKDSSYVVGCVIGGKVKDFENLLNKTVYIEKFCVFTEIFNPNSVYNLEYLYVDCNDIKVVEYKRKRKSSVKESRLKMTFLVLNKSNVTYSQNKGYHFWLEIEDFDNTYLKLERRCFLCFPGKFIRKWCLLQVSYTYTLYFEEDFQKVFEIELKRINPVLPQYGVSDRRDDAILGPREKQLPIATKPIFFNDESLVVDLNELLSENNKELFNFRAVLKTRKFNTSISSRTSNYSGIPPGFGNLGEKTHILEFLIANEGVKTLTLYMNNWERMVMPVGLIPGVLVEVRNVLVQKTYCKCTALTSIEVVEYKPKIPFRTANLFCEEDWGPPIHPVALGSVPSGVLAHIKIPNFTLKKFSMSRLCSECEFFSEQADGENCVKCHQKMVTSGSFSVNVYGYGTIICKDLDKIKVFFNLDDKLWEQLVKSLESIGTYSYNRHKDIDYSLSLPKRNFNILFNNLLKLIESRIDSKISTLCRKLDSDKSYTTVVSLWFMVDVKINN